MRAGRPRLTLYVRDGCALCEDLHADLLAFQAQLEFDLVAVDIDRDPALRARYDTRVPVLIADDREVCNYFLDPVALRGALTAE